MTNENKNIQPYAMVGRVHYTSDKKGREGVERGREWFRIDVTTNGSVTISTHSEIDDAPWVRRDVVTSLDPDFRPLDSFVRISLDDEFHGSTWFRFEDNYLECEGFTRLEGRISQKMKIKEPVRAFGSHAIVNDGFLMSLYDRSKGPGVQVFKDIPLSSPDHRGATGPMLFLVDVAIEYVGEEQITVPAGTFDAFHFRLVDAPGLPVEHPEYDLWCTTDGNYILLRAVVGGYMQTRYELAELEKVAAGPR